MVGSAESEHTRLISHEILFEDHDTSTSERTAPSKTKDRMSSVSLLMGVESNSGAADARATVTWPNAEVAARLSPFRTALLCARASTRESSNWVTASWHRVLQAERS